jgi:phosphomannomutase
MSYFRTCDIRGKYPDEIDEGLFHHFGWAIGTKLLGGSSILVASDIRLSSKSLKEALIDGLKAAGAIVFDAGRVPTPVVYYGKRKLGAVAAATVTASHNPPEDNGLKLLLGRYPATKGQLRSLGAESGPGAKPVSGGRIETINLAEAYLDYLAEYLGPRLSSVDYRPRISLVLDPGNGAWSLLAKEIMEMLALSAEFINAEPDGRFPNRSPDCAAPGNLWALARQVQQRGAAIGIAWDGDGDRLAICDDEGRILATDQLALLLLPEIMKGTNRQNILYDVKMSRKVRVAIECSGGIPVEQRSAHCYLERTMIDRDCLFGCEYSGHLFFRELLGADDGMYAALLLVDFLQRSHQPLSELVGRLPKLFVTPDLRFSGGPTDLALIRKRVEREFSPGSIRYLDGIKVESAEGWFLVRLSVSENKLSFRFEGESADSLESVITRMMDLLPEYSSQLEEAITRSRPVA